MRVISVVVAILWIACSKQADVTAPETGSGSGSAIAPRPVEPPKPAPKPVVTEAPKPPPPPSPPPKPAGFQVGDPVYGLWEGNDQWYPGKIGKVNGDGTYRVDYLDGDTSPKLAARRVKARKPSIGGGGGGGGHGNACPGVDLGNDPHNCGSCGRVCPEACMRGSCVSWAYKNG